MTWFSRSILMMTVSRSISSVWPHSGGKVFFNNPNPISMRRQLYGVDLTPIQPIIAFTVSIAICYNSSMIMSDCSLTRKTYLQPHRLQTLPPENIYLSLFGSRFFLLVSSPSSLSRHQLKPVTRLNVASHFRTYTTYPTPF